MTYHPTVLDLFCGAGGLSSGFQNAGCQIVGGIDAEDWPIRTHHHNFPDALIKLDACDIRSIEPSSLGLKPGSIDIIIGGPPCQGFSHVGRAKIKSLGLERERDLKNKLYQQYIRFVDYFQPTYFVVENVQGIKTFKQSKLFQKILSELEHGVGSSGYGSKIGYDIEYKILCAADYGVPQVRNRLFIVGRRKDLRHYEIKFPEGENVVRVTLKEAIDDLPVLRAPVLTSIRNGQLGNGGIKQFDHPKKYVREPKNWYQRLMRAGCGATVNNHICRGHNEKDLEIFRLLKPGQKYVDLPLHHRRYRDDIFSDKYRRLVASEPSWTLTAHMQKDCLAYIHPSQTRSLSAREAARIQSFPDSFMFLGPLTKVFRMIGNAVPPLLAEKVARPIVQELRREDVLARSAQKCSLS